MTTERSVARAVLGVALAMSAGCAPRAEQDAASLRAAASEAVRTWPLPAANGQQPDLEAAPDGSLLLSWVEPADGGSQRLRFARWANGRWSAPADVIAGEGIGNTADTPHLRQTPDGALWALWLRKIGEGHARDVMLARSADGGRHWSRAVAVNTDGTATEHGFASTWTDGASSLGVAWLDGREKAGESHGHDMHAMRAADAESAHATMLRSAVFAPDLSRRDESAVDTATCDCCQTDAVALADGPRLVYRDRSPGEIRDIALLARARSGWSAPRRVHDDGWRMPGCPVNGPAVAGAGRELVVAWYTMRDGQPTVRVARSGDGGATFGRAVDVASSKEVLGRVDVALAGGDAWVTWLSEDAQGQTLHAAQVSPDGSIVRRLDVAKLAGRGRGTGWPRLAACADGLGLVWTDVRDGRPVVHGAWLPTTAGAGH